VEALAAATQEDLLVVGKQGWARLPHRRLGSTPRQLLGQAQVSVMVYSQPRRDGHPVLVLFDSPEAGARTLALAGYIAPRPDTELVLLLPPGAATPLREAAGRAAEDRGGRVTVRELEGREAPALAGLVRRTTPHALVVSRDSPFLAATEGYRLLEELELPVVVVP
jgi:hypothetical protein